MLRLTRNFTTICAALAVLLSTVVARPPATFAESAGPRIIETTVKSIVFELDVPQPAFDQVEVDGRVFDRVTLPGYASTGLPGQPELPQIGLSLGIPAEGEVTVRVLDAKEEDLPGTYTVLPASAWTVQRDPETGQAVAEAGVKAEFALDADIYAQDSFMPVEVATLDETAFVRQQRIARVTLHPVQVNPARGQVKVARYLRVEVSFAAPPPSAASVAFTEDAFDPILRDQLLNFEQARQWQAPRQAAALVKSTASAYPGDTSRPWFKTQVRFSGLYRVTLADLRGSDLAPLAAANPARLQVWKNGQQVPAQFLGDNDALFEPAEQLLFYADVEPDIYSDTDVVWLTIGDEQGLRMVSTDATPVGAVTDTFLPAKVHAEEDFAFVHDVPKIGTPAYPRWYWLKLDSLFLPSRTVPFVVSNPVTSGYSAQLRIRLAGSTESTTANPDHLVRVELNGQVLGNVVWDGKEVVVGQFDLPASSLRAGLNTITLATPGGLPGVTLEQAYLDWIEISYRQIPKAVSDRLAFQIDGSEHREFQVTAFEGQNVVAYDVSDPTAPIQLQNMQISNGLVEGEPDTVEPALPTDQPRRTFLPLVGNVSPSAAVKYRARFGQTIAGQRSYLVTTLEAVHNIDLLSRDRGSTLHAATNQAAYLLVTHRDFMAAAQALASHRRSQGLTVAVVDIQDIYDEFGNGQLDPRAIRAFVDYAYHNWQSPAPTYVLLLGDGHYDYRMYTGLTMTPNFVPPYFTCADPYVCEVAIDNEFVTVSGNDRLPDLAIGRLPANTAASAMVMVNKIISYETAPPPGAWGQTLAFVADNYRSSSGVADPAGNFEALTEGVIATIPGQYPINRVFFDPYPSDDGGEPFRYRTPQATTSAIVGSINGGNLFLNYIGHASNNTWANESILQATDRGRNDVLLMTNGPRLPIVLDMACLSGNFAEPQYTGIEAKMLEWTGGGSVAAWGATGFGVATGHDWLHRGFYRAVFTNGVRPVGLAAVAGKQYLWTNGPHFDDLLDTFGLLGDPALRIAFLAGG